VCNLVAHNEGGTWDKVFENRMLRRKFEPRRDEVAKEWKILYNK